MFFEPDLADYVAGHPVLKSALTRGMHLSLRPHVNGCFGECRSTGLFVVLKEHPRERPRETGAKEFSSWAKNQSQIDSV